MKKKPQEFVMAVAGDGKDGFCYMIFKPATRKIIEMGESHDKDKFKAEVLKKTTEYDIPVKTIMHEGPRCLEI